MNSRHLFAVLLCAAQLVSSSANQPINVSHGASTTHTASAGQWTKVGRIDSSHSFQTLYSHTGALYAGVEEDGIYRSTDQGRTWSQLNNGIPESPFVGRLALDFEVSGATLFVASTGVYRLNDQGNGWIAASNGLPAARQITLPIGALAVSGATLVAAVIAPTVSGPKVYRSTNQGQSWEPAVNGLPNDLLFERLVANDSTLLIETDSHGLYRSTDRGLTWSPANNGLEGFNGRFISLAGLGNDLFAAIQDEAIYRSSDQGQSWAKVSSLKIRQSDLLKAAGSNLLAISESKIYLSTDRGSAWTKLGDDPALPAFFEFTVSDGRIFAAAQANNCWDIYAGENFLPAALTIVSAASYAPFAAAPESIVAAFGVRLATETRTATELPLPTVLAGTSLLIKDSAGIERAAPLFFVSPGQINCQIPANTAIGTATITGASGDGAFSAGVISIVAVAPGLFAANSNGQGVAAAVALRVKADGTQSYEPVAQWDTARQQYVSLPIDLGPQGEPVYLILFGTGLRFLSGLSEVSVTVGGSAVSVLFAGPQDGNVGLDQINAMLPHSLAGRGEVDVILTVAGQTSNAVRINVQ